MNRIDVIIRPLLLTFLLASLSSCETNSSKGDWKSGSSPFYAYFLLVLLPSITPDASCTSNIVGKPRLQLSTPVEANSRQLYLIYPEKKPIKVKTLFLRMTAGLVVIMIIV